MRDVLIFRRNHSTAAVIAAHLAVCDADFVPPLSLRVSIDEYAAKLACQGERFEAWAGEDLAGLVVAYCNQPEKTTAFVSSVSIAPSWRGVGIGDRLIENCLNYAAACGFGQVELRVSAVNAGALRLYERHGFGFGEADGEDVILRRNITPLTQQSGTS